MTGPGERQSCHPARLHTGCCESLGERWALPLPRPAWDTAHFLRLGSGHAGRKHLLEHDIRRHIT